MYGYYEINSVVELFYYRKKRKVVIDDCEAKAEGWSSAGSPCDEARTRRHRWRTGHAQRWLALGRASVRARLLEGA